MKWFINGSQVTEPIDAAYGEKGIAFHEEVVATNSDGHTYNLTIIVNVSVAINTTTFVCNAFADTPAFSHPAQLIVMGKYWILSIAQTGFCRVRIVVCRAHLE